MKEIELTKGYVAQVDDEWFPVLSQWKWHALETSGKVYACRSSWKPRRSILMHRVILDAPPNKEVDHVDGNGLNNQETNLRLCTSQQNKANRGLLSTNTSGFKGVSFHRPSGEWVAHIKWSRKQYNLGHFKTKEEAALVYNAKARELHGEFAYQNDV